MDIKKVITKALHENFSEFTEDQAAAVIEAIKANGFVLIKSPITDEMQKAGKEATGMGMFGYDMQDVLDAMIEAQDPAKAVLDSPTEKTWDEIHLDPKERLYWSLHTTKKCKSDLNWHHASHKTCVGSTHGKKICEYLGVDPDGKDFVRTLEPIND